MSVPNWLRRLRPGCRASLVSEDEMRKIIRRQPHGPVRALPNLLTIGVTDVDRFGLNMEEGAKRSRRAMKLGCYLEVISLRIQHAELWLRMYWVAKNNKGKIIDPEKRGPTFGDMIGRCAGLGFRSDLIKRLEDFNDDRRKAVHSYLMGSIAYADLRDCCERSAGLDADVRQYVMNEVAVELEA